MGEALLPLCLWGLLASWGSFGQRVLVAAVHCSAQAPGEHGMSERETETETERKRVLHVWPSNQPPARPLSPHSNVPSDARISHIV